MERTREDFQKEAKDDLITRLMHAQWLGHFLLDAYDALKNYGVDFKALKAWHAMGEYLDKAAKQEPHAAQKTIAAWFTSLEADLWAAIRRRKLVLVGKGGEA